MFFALLHAILRRLRVFSSYRLALTVAGNAGATQTLRWMCGPRPGSMARALGMQSRATWLFPKGLGSTTLSREGHKTNSNFTISTLSLWCRSGAVCCIYTVTFGFRCMKEQGTHTEHTNLTRLPFLLAFDDCRCCYANKIMLMLCW